jgi:hypothetical protein
MGNLDYLKEIISRDYTTYSGKILEKYFNERLKAEKKYNIIGPYWDGKNQNEIDIVAINELDKIVLFAEVKRNKNNINLKVLEEKSSCLMNYFEGYKILYKGFSLDDI